MKLVIIPCMVWLISVALAIKSPGLLEVAKKRSNQEDPIEGIVCAARIENIKFKCDLQYRKIDIKTDLNRIKSRTVCKKVLNNLDANCDEAGNENCWKQREKLKQSCQIRLDEIKQHQSEAYHSISKACDEALEDAKYECARNGPSVTTDVNVDRPKRPWRSEERKVAKSPKSKDQSLINFIFGDSQYSIPKPDLSSYINEVFGEERVQEKSVQKILPSAVSGSHKYVEEPEPVGNVNPSEAQASLAEQDAEKLSKLTKNPRLNQNMKLTTPTNTITSKEKFSTGSIVNFIFGDNQHSIPKSDLVTFVTEIYKTTSPSSVIPTQMSKEIPSSGIPTFVNYNLESALNKNRNGKLVLNSNVDSLIDYIFERLKHKIANHAPFSSADHKWGGNIQPIVSYLFGRYKRKIVKHNLSSVDKNKGDERSILLGIIMDLLKGRMYRAPQSSEKRPVHIYLTNGRRNPRFYKISRFNDDRSRIRIPEKFNISFIFQILDEIFGRTGTSRFYSKPTTVEVIPGRSKSKHFKYQYHHIGREPKENPSIPESNDSDVMIIYRIISNLLQMNKSGLVSILDTIYYRINQNNYPQRSKYDIQLILKILDRILHGYLNGGQSHRKLPSAGRTGLKKNRPSQFKFHSIPALQNVDSKKIKKGVDVTFIFNIIDDLFKEGSSFGEEKPRKDKTLSKHKLFKTHYKIGDDGKDKSESQVSEEAQIVPFDGDKDKVHHKPQVGINKHKLQAPIETDEAATDETNEEIPIVSFKPDRGDTDKHKVVHKPHVAIDKDKLQISKPGTEVAANVGDQVEEAEIVATTVKTTTKKIKKIEDKSKFTTKMPKQTTKKQLDKSKDEPLLEPIEPIMSSVKPVVGSEMKTSTASSKPESTDTSKIHGKSNSVTTLKVEATGNSILSVESLSKSTEAPSLVTQSPSISGEQLKPTIEQSTISLEKPTISPMNSMVSGEQQKLSTDQSNLPTKVLKTASEEPNLTGQTAGQTTEKAKLTTEQMMKTSEKP